MNLLHNLENFHSVDGVDSLKIIKILNTDLSLFLKLEVNYKYIYCASLLYSYVSSIHIILPCAQICDCLSEGS